MTVVSLGGFALAMFVLAVTPGPGVFATVSRALSAGFGKSLPVVAGIVAGDLVFLLFALYGLSALAEVFGGFFQCIRYGGCLYLVYLGVRLWRDKGARPEMGGASSSRLIGFWGGLSITLGNPKVILFYCSFLPQFMELRQLSHFDVLAVAATLVLVLGSVMLVYAYSAARARLLFKSPQARQRMNRTAGTVMIGTGAVLLCKS